PTPTELMRELSADRPDRTDTPFTVDAGHFQVEMDFANLTKDRSGEGHNSVSTTSFEIAPMNLKAGLLNNLDFQLLFTPYRWEKSTDEGTGQSEWRNGFDGITPRFKINLVGNDGGFFALGLIPFLKLPLANTWGPASVEGGLGIPYAFDVENWD